MANTNGTRTRRTPEESAQIAKDVLKAVRKSPATIHEIGARAGLCAEGEKLTGSTLAYVRSVLKDSDKVVSEGKTRATKYAKAG